MGWTILYIAFGIVALWLLGEVLLQYKARLRWRFLAFVGFLGVVIGVLVGLVVVIGLGAVAFAIGQTQVTLSFRRGFSTGWALGGKPGASKRRRSDPGQRPAVQEPTLEVSDLEYGPEPGYGPDPEAIGRQAPDLGYGGAPAPTPSAPPVYAPEPLPEDTGQYGIYGADTGVEYGFPPPAPTDTMGYAPAADTAYAAAGAPQAPDYGSGPAAYGYDAYDQQQYGYDPGGQQYPEYSAEPYAGASAAPGMDGVAAGAQSYEAPQAGDDPYGDQSQYGYPSQDPYASASYGMQTPPGGVWMPPQRATEGQYGGELPPEQQYPYQNQPGGYDSTGYEHEHGQGYDEQQYRS